jgi:hypothetical protein
MRKVPTTLVVSAILLCRVDREATLNWRVEAVAAALGRDSVPIHAVLCFIDAGWPLIGAPNTSGAALIDGKRAVRKRAQQLDR